MIDYLCLTGLFLFSFIVSTLLIRLAIPKLKANGIQEKTLPESSSFDRSIPSRLDSGLGSAKLCWSSLLCAKEEFNALAIIVGAKEFVRKEKLQQNPPCYLLGTLVNLSVAVLFACYCRAHCRVLAGGARRRQRTSNPGETVKSYDDVHPLQGI